ncbi:MAG TPA: hypothetical protein VH208_00565 [Myxococcaceae bacterium]|nr:hypothetical protein [Myxococcaceae bacterium]
MTPTDLFILRCRHSLLRDVVRLADMMSEEDAAELGLRLRRAAGAIPSQIGDGATAASSALVERAIATAAEVGTLLRSIGEVGAAPAHATESLLLKVSAIRNIAELTARNSASFRGAPREAPISVERPRSFSAVPTLDGPLSLEGGRA